MFYKLLENGAIEGNTKFFEGATELNIEEKDIQFLRLINGQLQVSQQAKQAYETNTNIAKQISAAVLWFDNFYRLQLEQAQRAQRTGTTWYSNDGQKTYSTLAELDAEANNKQNQIRTLKAQLQE